MLWFLILGVGTSAFLFGTHDILCRYDMNPLCFFECVIPIIISAPLIFLDE